MELRGGAIPSESSLSATVCVVGTGPVGLAIARSLTDSGCDTIVIESGHPDYPHSARRLDRVLRSHLRGPQRLAAGEVAGEPYFPLRFARARSYGGTSPVWRPHGLRSRPLDASDFSGQAGLDAWPITRQLLEPYWAPAHEALGLGPPDYQPERWCAEHPAEGVDVSIFQHGRASAIERLGARVAASEQAQVVTGATVRSLAFDRRSGDVVRADAETLEGSRFSVSASQYIIAAGGIENARLLMLSEPLFESVGGDAGPLGRSFMEHPSLPVAYLRTPPGRLGGAPFAQRAIGGTEVIAAWQLDEETRRTMGLQNASFNLQRVAAWSASRVLEPARHVRRLAHHGPIGRDLLDQALRVPRSIPAAIRNAFGHRGVDRETYLLHATIEQAPNPMSRVTLGRRTDALGQRVARLDWHTLPRDWRSLHTTLLELKRRLADADIGELECLVGPERPSTPVYGAWHHMGTTRMHADPARGVVDANCRVHGVGNLYMAGSSVFSTGGMANPTLTATALGLRTADHLLGVA